MMTDSQELQIERIMTNQLGVDVGVISLNRPEALNALNDAMVAGLEQQLREWAADDRIAMVIIKGNGARAYCAGGDIKALCDAGTVKFLAAEYRLDYALYAYPKPVLHFMHGVVMGGGIGLMASGALRVCLKETTFAMPETAIGFIPDVGYRYHLARMRDGVGALLALTGATFTPKLAKYLGLVDYVLPQTERRLALSHLYECIARWQKSEGDILPFIKSWIESLVDDTAEDLAEPTPAQPVSQTEWDEWDDEWDADFVHLIPENVREWCENYWSYPALDWLDALDSLVRELDGLHKDLFDIRKDMLDGLSPLSVAVTDRMLRRAAEQDLKRVFEEDYWVADKLYREGDLKEGVLAKMIEKRPACWRYTTHELYAELLDTFEPPTVIASVLRQQIHWPDASGSE